MPRGWAKEVVADPGAGDLERTYFIIGFFMAITEAMFADDVKDGRNECLEIGLRRKTEVVHVAAIGNDMSSTEIEDVGIHV